MANDLMDLARYGKSLATADHFQVFHCPTCRNAHVVLFDENDEPFAQMTVGPTQLRVINDGCHAVFELKKVDA